VTTTTSATTSARGRTRLAPDQRRTQLLDLGVSLLATRSLDELTIDVLAEEAGISRGLLYHYFGGKDELYVAVLEAVLADLRHDELQLDAEAVEPLEGLLRIYDFVDTHYAPHPRLRKLLAFENLNEARHLARSSRIPEMASPTLSLIRKLLARGVANGQVRAGVDALHLYVAMVSLSYYGRAHAPTLSRIFNKDLQKASWQKAHQKLTRQMVAAFLTSEG